MDSGLMKPNSTHSFIASSNEDSLRLDKFITKQFPLYSRSYFQRLIDEGLVTVNNNALRKSSIALKTNDVISITFPKEREVDTEAMNTNTQGIEIVHEETHFMVLTKPAGLNTHAAHARSKAVSLVDYLVTNYNEIALVGYVDRPGIVHRLDKDTSGLIVIARTNHAHGVFGQKFHDREIQKTYYAVAHGHPAAEGTIDLSIGRDPNVPVKMRAYNPLTVPENSPKIRNAVSHYRVLEYFEDCALIEIKPVTGRTHQIRVHLAAIGHPIVGDHVYGTRSKLIERHALHAYGLEFEFEGKAHSLVKEMPADMMALVKQLREKSLSLKS